MRWCTVLIGALLAACSSPLTEARTSFDEARYPDAVSEYSRLAAAVPSLSPTELFEYSLYRGLSHLALGDSAPAERWLTLAKRLMDSAPARFPVEQRHRLLVARRAMGHAAGE